METSATQKPPTGDFTILAVESTEMRILRDRSELIGRIDSALGTIFRVRLSDTESQWSSEGFLVDMVGVGRLDAAIHTLDVLEHVDTPRIFLIGVVGGFEDRGIALGDIVVADQIIDYEMQRLTDEGPEYRTRRYRLDESILQACQAVIDDTAEQPGEAGTGSSALMPQYHIGTVLSGDKVIASSSTASSLLKRYPESLGVEMEGAGVAAALASRHRLRSLCMIRGVSDVANSHKRIDAQKWRQIACERAAHYTVEVIRESTTSSWY